MLNDLFCSYMQILQCDMKTEDAYLLGNIFFVGNSHYLAGEGVGKF